MKRLSCPPLQNHFIRKLITENWTFYTPRDRKTFDELIIHHYLLPPGVTFRRSTSSYSAMISSLRRGTMLPTRACSRTAPGTESHRRRAETSTLVSITTYSFIRYFPFLTASISALISSSVMSATPAFSASLLMRFMAATAAVAL